MTSETENKITWTVVILGVIAAIVTLCFHQPRSPIGDCGTDVTLNKGIGIFFATALNVLLVAVAAFHSMIIGFAITGAINSGERYIYRMKQKKENPKANSTSFSFKNINYKKIVYNCIDGMRQFEVAWLVITISILSVAGFFAGMNHPKICFKNPGAVSDFYLISALYLVIIGLVATFVFHILFEKIEFRLKKFLKLV